MDKVNLKMGGNIDIKSEK